MPRAFTRKEIRNVLKEMIHAGVVNIRAYTTENGS